MLNVEKASRKEIEAFLISQGLTMPSNMLSVGKDNKTVKGEKYGYLTGVLYLLPDYTICPASKLAQCDKPCLVTAGKGAFTTVKQGRHNKTELFKRFPHVFYELVRRDIKKLAAKAEREGLQYCVRLNGTSDINHNAFIATLPEVTFYDYTKMADRESLPNYHLTFSFSGANPKYYKHVQKALDKGLNLAVVFRKAAIVPKTFLGLPVINGDDSDLRFLDYKVNPNQSVVALYAKGKARKDSSGFVIDSNRIGVIQL